MLFPNILLEEKNKYSESGNQSLPSLGEIVREIVQ